MPESPNLARHDDSDIDHFDIRLYQHSELLPTSSLPCVLHMHLTVTAHQYIFRWQSRRYHSSVHLFFRPSVAILSDQDSICGSAFLYQPWQLALILLALTVRGRTDLYHFAPIGFLRLLVALDLQLAGMPNAFQI